MLVPRCPLLRYPSGHSPQPFLCAPLPPAGARPAPSAPARPVDAWRRPGHAHQPARQPAAQRQGAAQLGERRGAAGAAAGLDVAAQGRPPLAQQRRRVWQARPFWYLTDCSDAVAAPPTVYASCDCCDLGPHFHTRTCLFSNPISFGRAAWCLPAVRPLTRFLAILPLSLLKTWLQIQNVVGVIVPHLPRAQGMSAQNRGGIALLILHCVHAGCWQAAALPGARRAAPCTVPLEPGLPPLKAAAPAACVRPLPPASVRLTGRPAACAPPAGRLPASAEGHAPVPLPAAAGGGEVTSWQGRSAGCAA